MISFRCPGCQMKLTVKPEYAGRSAKCPTCKQPLTVPTPNATTAWIAPQQIDGAESSLAKIGLDGGVTLAHDPGGRKPTALPGGKPQRAVGDALAGRAKNHGRYVIEGEIARGGMGAVLRAVDGDIRREIAVKYMLDDKDPKKKARFIEEAQINGQLEHPNIVPVYDLGIDAQKRPFIMMKMVKGRSLKDVLDQLRDNPKQAEKEHSLGRLLNILVNVCNGLAFAHAHGVVHRDLKPANIMLGDFGEVYVMDWGLAKVLKGDGDAGMASGPSASLPGSTNITAGRSPKVATSREPEADLTQDGEIVGTPVYMSPEQAGCNMQAVDQRSDVYALGAILYEMLTLQAPIDKTGGYLAVLIRVMEGEIVPPEKREPQRTKAGRIPPELSAIAMKALAKEREQRYPTVEAMRRDLERFLEGRSVSAKEDTKGEMIWKFVKRNKGFSAAAAVVLMILVASLYFVGLAWQKERKANDSLIQAQKDKDERTQGAVPALVSAARLAGENRDLKTALDQLDLALIYSPYDLPAHQLRGQVLIAQLDFAGARAALQRYLELEPKDADAKELLRLCQNAKREDGERLLQLAEILLRQKRYGLSSCLLQEVAQHVKNREKLVPALSKRINAAWPGLGNQLGVVPDGSLKLNLGQQERQVLDLTPLQGMPLNILYLNACSRVRDLAPLKGMPLHTLDLYGCNQVQDLAPLAGMPLTSLYLNGCNQVRDLSPLQGMPLTTLSLYGCSQVHNLAPLGGMPLTDLNLYKCEGVSDLTPLQGMPLVTLECGGTKVSDLAPLRGLKLTTLYLWQSPIHDISPLRGMPLTKLRLAACQIRDLSPLRGMPLTELDTQDCPISDLTPLKGMKISNLRVDRCTQVRDLEPLRGMPLTQLIMAGTAVKELDPLKGMPLTHLYISGTKIADLAPLKGMPLKTLHISLTPVEDLSPLRGMQLDGLLFSPKNVKKGIEIIRQMKSLRNIAIDADLPKDRFPPAEFWKRYDAGEFSK